MGSTWFSVCLMIKKLLSLYLAVKLQRRIAVYSNTYVNITIWFIVISKEMIKGKTLAFLFSGWKFIKTNNLSRLSIRWTSRVYVIVAIQTIFFIIQRVLMHFFFNHEQGSWTSSATLVSTIFCFDVQQIWVSVREDIVHLFKSLVGH
jgi:hypothetical protein